MIRDSAHDRLKGLTPFLVNMHKSADAQRKKDEARLAEGPKHFGKPSDTRRQSSIDFWNLWH